MNSITKISIFAGGVILGFFFVLIGCIFLDIDQSTLEKLKALFSAGILMSVIIAILQYFQNIKNTQNDRLWNQKYLAYTEMNNILQELQKQRTIIDEIVIRHQLIKNDKDELISFSDRKNMSDHPLQYREVHNWVCKKDDTGNNVKISAEDHYCSMTAAGSKVVRSLIAIINTYESLVIGMNQGILNKDMILEGFSSSIISNFQFMEDYIQHRRKKHDNPTLATEWESLYHEIKDER